MPKKAVISKEQIVEKAFEIVRKEGFDGITARRLSSELSCSTQPIYYLFKNMQDLKKEVYEYGKEWFHSYTHSIRPQTSKENEFLEAGVAYIKAAKQENHLFRFLCFDNNYSLPGVSEMVDGAPLDEKASKLFLDLWLYAHGIACVTCNNDVPVKEEEIRKLLGDAAKGFYHVIYEEEE